jgi:hypothetical protein
MKLSTVHCPLSDEAAVPSVRESRVPDAQGSGYAEPSRAGRSCPI